MYSPLKNPSQARRLGGLEKINAFTIKKSATGAAAGRMNL
jgi:hypothetical protein